MVAVEAVAGDARASLPRRFGRYQLFDHIGRGGMAEIFLARAETGIAGASRLVVVKEIHAALSGDPQFAAMFADEAKLCAGLRHANIVQVVDLGRAEGPDGTALLFMAMEYVEGLDLNQLLRRLSQKKIPLALEFAIHVVHEVLAALDFAHRATDGSGRPLGIVHRDVSPSNVLMSMEGEVKLCDFGIAKAFGGAGHASAGTGSEAQAGGRAKVVGKSAYMSPEQARGESLDGRADVFAAGILLWELCAGRRLYRGSEDEMLEQATRAEIPPLPDRGLPAQATLQAVLERALAAGREDRFASAAAMRAELDAYAHEARIFASPIKFGAFLTDHFETDLLGDRRARERATRPPSLPPTGAAARSDAPAPDESASAVVAIPANARAPSADLDLAELPTPVPPRDADSSAPPDAGSVPVSSAAQPSAVPAIAPSPATSSDDDENYTVPLLMGVAAAVLTGLAIVVYFLLW